MENTAAIAQTGLFWRRGIAVVVTQDMLQKR